MKVKSENEVAQSCRTLRDPMDCSLPGSSIHGIFQARVLEWGAIAFSNICLGEWINNLWYFHIIDGCVARIGKIFDSVIKHHQAMLLSMKRISQNSMYNTPLIYMHTCHPELCACVCLCTNTQGNSWKDTGLYQGGPSCFYLCTVLFELLTIKMYVRFL